MLTNDTQRNGTSRIGLYGSVPPGDFVTKVKQINRQSDLIWMMSFAGLSYLTVRSFVYMILI